MKEQRDSPLALISFEAPALPVAVDGLHDALDRFWAGAAQHSLEPVEDWRAQFATAVIEIASNVIRHAYDNRPPGLLGLELRLHGDRVEALFQDHGRPYVASPERALGDLTGALGVPEGGYGLSLVRALVDRLQYSREGDVNHWLLVKALVSSDRPG